MTGPTDVSPRRALLRDPSDDSSVQETGLRHYKDKGITTHRIGDHYPALWVLLFDQLRDDIAFRKRLSGTRLLEAKLAHEFGVSRGPIRTALRELERVGLATTTARKGTIVAAMTSRDIRELFSVRQVLERLAAKEACSAGPPSAENLALMGAALDRHQAMLNGGNAREVIDADLAFHRQICIASGNSRLLVAWTNLSDQLRRIIAAVQKADESVASAQGQHHKILEALSRGDGEAAAAAISQHIEDARVVMLTLSDSDA